MTCTVFFVPFFLGGGGLLSMISIPQTLFSVLRALQLFFRGCIEDLVGLHLRL